MFNRNPAAAAPQILGVRPHSPRWPAATVIEFLRSGTRRFAAWRKQRRERKELHEFLGDHRAAADIGYRHRRG